VLLLYLPHFPRTHLIEKSSTQTGTPSSRFFLLHWLGCHSNRPGTCCLRTIQVPVAVSQLWHHNQVIPDWSDCVSMPSKELPIQSPTTSVAVSWQDLQILGLLFSSMFPCQLVQGWTGMTFLSCSKELPIWNPQCRRQEEFLMVSTIKPQAHCSSISQENSMNIG
jgi:hypothetical protein